MSQNRPWQTALSSLVITLVDNETIAAETITEISSHEAITVEEAEGIYLPVAIVADNARPIHQWLESLPGVQYIDVVFCSTELSNEESTSPLAQ